MLIQLEFCEGSWSGCNQTYRPREIVSLQDPTSPCSELREKLKCIGYIGKND